MLDRNHRSSSAHVSFPEHLVGRARRDVGGVATLAAAQQFASVAGTIVDPTNAFCLA